MQTWHGFALLLFSVFIGFVYVVVSKWFLRSKSYPNISLGITGSGEMMHWEYNYHIYINCPVLRASRVWATILVSASSCPASPTSDYLPSVDATSRPVQRKMIQETGCTMIEICIGVHFYYDTSWVKIDYDIHLPSVTCSFFPSGNVVSNGHNCEGLGEFFFVPWVTQEIRKVWW